MLTCYHHGTSLGLTGSPFLFLIRDGSPQPKAVPPRVSRWARGRGVAAPEVATSATSAMSAVLPGQVQGDAEQRERLGR